MSSTPIASRAPIPKDTQTIESLTSITLDEPPSCIEFWPSDPEYFVVGTYVLESGRAGEVDENDRGEGKVQTRSGSLVLMRLVEGKIIHLCTTSLPHAILDLRFCSTYLFFFAVATSNGSISLYSLNPNASPPIIPCSTFQICETSILVLSLAWQPDSAKGWEVAFSLSNGEVGIFDCKGKAERVARKKNHEAEAWCVVWNWDGKRVWSGGDDSVICGSDIGEARSDEDDIGGLGFANVCIDRKTHGAGVTAILPIDLEDEMDRRIVVTGSYDEFVRVLEPPGQGGRFKMLTEKRLGGGVWRLMLLDIVDVGANGEVKFQVLASCMHAGARIVQIHRSTKGEWTVEDLAKFEEHESMNYGSDAHAVATEDGRRSWICVSTSFYDKRLCVWKFEDG